MKCYLKQALNSKNKKISWLVEKTGIHRNSLSDYANNKALPRIDNAYLIAKALDKTVQEIWPPD